MFYFVSLKKQEAYPSCSREFIKEDGTTGTKRINMTDKKRVFIDHYFFVENIDDKFFFHKGSSLVFSKEWFDVCISEEDDVRSKCVATFHGDKLSHLSNDSFYEGSYNSVILLNNSNLILGAIGASKSLEVLFGCLDLNRIKIPIQPNPFFQLKCFKCRTYHSIDDVTCLDDLLHKVVALDHEINEPQIMCNLCYDDLVENTCERCGITYKIIADHTDKYCYKCIHNMYRCKTCKDFFEKEDMVIYPDGEICMGCAEKKNICSTCGFPINLEDKDMYEIINKRKYCKVCAYDYKYQRQLNRYDYKPKAIFYKKKPTELFLGFEIEVESNQHHPKKLATFLNSYLNFQESKFNEYVYIKHDGSLTGGLGGLEIVTHPIAYNDLDIFKPMFDKVFDLRKLGVIADESENCGLHIHVSRKGFKSDEHIKNMILFVNLNSSYFIKLSNRKSREKITRYCPFNLDAFYINELLHNPDNVPDAHHRAVTVTPKTVEFRFFKGTLDSKKFYGFIELCKKLIDFTEDGGNDIEKFKTLIEEKV